MIDIDPVMALAVQQRKVRTELGAQRAEAKARAIEKGEHRLISRHQNDPVNGTEQAFFVAVKNRYHPHQAQRSSGEFWLKRRRQT